MKLKQKGFTTLEILLVFIILAAVSFVGYYVYNSKKQTDKLLNSAQNETSAVKVSKTTVTSFDECQKAAGSIDQETYPVVCVTKDGKQFIQPTLSTQGFLDIKELGIKLPVPSSVSDLTYTWSHSVPGSDNVAVLHSQSAFKFEQQNDPTCAAEDAKNSTGPNAPPVDWAGYIDEVTAPDNAGESNVVVINGRTYAFTGHQNGCETSDKGNPKAVNQKMTADDGAIFDALKQAAAD